MEEAGHSAQGHQEDLHRARVLPLALVGAEAKTRTWQVAGAHPYPATGDVLRLRNTGSSDGRRRR